MLIDALVFSACLVLVFGSFYVALRVWWSQEKAKAQKALREFVTSPDESTPSPLAIMLDPLATLVAARLVQQVKAMLAGVESGESKREQAQLIEGMIGSNPWLSLASQVLPKRLTKKLMSNPQMVGALGQIMAEKRESDNGHTTGGDAPPVRRHRE